MLDLHDIIANPGVALSYRRELGTDRLQFLPVLGYESPPVGEGVIVSQAGELTLRGTVTADMLCVCDRCMVEYPYHKIVELNMGLASELEDEDSPDYFLLDGESLDIDDLLETAFILNMDSRFLCHPDCRGLCPRCGVDLNRGSCHCEQEPDPRLAVLEQLLDNKKD